ncbi:hypothetical protein PVK06_046948 [Gossypium arboreum]|uniref:14-3-3 domain-containing protein n=1 Tax=Gossypium arboreum TaxID=29729 RepID=A0ABR0MEL1_GOSAR|nr:hypothetical protein PVK06_046948 [Gossypium arboreum]
MAKLTEQVERYEEMVKFIENAASAIPHPDELSIKEHNLLSVAYKNVTVRPSRFMEDRLLHRAERGRSWQCQPRCCDPPVHIQDRGRVVRSMHWNFEAP